MGKVWEHFYDAVLRVPLSRVYANVHGPRLWALAWVLAILGFVYWQGGKEAVLSPAPVVVAAGGAALLFAAGMAWIRRIQPLVLVARFGAVGSSLAREEADAIQDQIIERLREQAASVGERPRWVVRSLDTEVDPGDPREHVGRTASKRAPVLVSGKVRVTERQWVCAVQVITPSEQLVWKQELGKQFRLELPTPQFEMEGVVQQQRFSSDVAATATLSLGLAFLARGKYPGARQLLEAEDGSLATFYAALAAFMMEDLEAALVLAQRSWSLLPFRPTAALAAAAAFQLARPTLGQEWVARRNRQPTPTGEWAQLVADLEPLSSAHAVVAILETTNASLENTRELLRAAEKVMGPSPVSINPARDAIHEGDYESAYEYLTQSKPDGPMALAMLALAAVHLDLDGASDLARAAEAAIAADADHVGARYLAEAYAVANDPVSFARVWDWRLENAFRGRAARVSGTPSALLNATVLVDQRRLRGSVSQGFWEHPDVSQVIQHHLAIVAETETRNRAPGVRPGDEQGS